MAGVVFDNEGNLYGTTNGGGRTVTDLTDLLYQVEC
jgi:hypothetical protein